MTFMATRRRSTATKSAKAASAPVKKSPSVVTKVTKYSKPIEIKKVTETPTPARVRPEKPNLSFEDYSADVKVRWEIHQWETQELWKDCVRGYQQLKPIGQKVVTYCIESYNRAFNGKEGQKTN
tara:strand:- start:81 stop:452 length:372 start_codon:yes stop_codon:yes gene_type:complete